MPEPKVQAAPPRCSQSLIVSTVAAYARNFPHLGPPMFHADDVLPMLTGDDTHFETASALLEAGRVFYPDGAP